VLYREDNNFLEGFYFDKRTFAFYESAGLYNKSSVHRLTPDAITNTLTVDTDSLSFLPSKYFGEGLAPRSATEFALLTYREKTVLTVDRDTMSILSKSFVIPSQLKEGWGMTADESKVNSNGFYTMYASDGSYHIFVIDGETMKVTNTLNVRDTVSNTYVSRINELEYANGFIYANVWYKDILLKIDPTSGSIVK